MLYPFPTFPTACLSAFIILARVFLDRAIHAFFRSVPFPTFPTACLSAFIISARVFLERAIHRRSSVPFPTFPTACLSAFIISARVFLERAIHAFFRSIPNVSNRVLICVYYFRARVLRTSHTCVLPFSFGARVFRTSHTCVVPFSFGARVFRTSHTVMRSSVPFPPFPSACLSAFIILARVVLERAIHAFFRSVPNCFNCDFICVYYFGSRVEPVVWIDYRPGTS